MAKPYRSIHKLGTVAAKRTIVKQHGKHFYRQFQTISKHWINTIAGKTPDIGNTIFSWNYAFAPAYIAWWKAGFELSGKEQADKLLWTINACIFSKIPKRLAPFFIKCYLSGFRKKAPVHQKLGEQHRLHPYDYRLRFRNISETVFEINIYECGMRKLAKDFGADEMFPSICRIDYLMFHMGGAGFERTKTLGDGDDCCNCRYIYGGTCEWAPEQGFDTRK